MLSLPNVFLAFLPILLNKVKLMFDRKILLDDKTKIQKLISVISSEMHTFQLEINEMHAFRVQMNETTDSHSKLLVSWKLVTEGYQGRPMKCVRFTHLKLIERPLPGKVILCFFSNFIYY